MWSTDFTLVCLLTLSLNMRWWDVWKLAEGWPEIVVCQSLKHFDGDSVHAVLGVSCGFTRHGCSFWCLYPQNPFSIHIFSLVINMERNQLWKYWAISVLCHFVAISTDLKICTMSKALSWLSAGIDECCKSANEIGRYRLKNSWLATIWP